MQKRKDTAPAILDEGLVAHWNTGWIFIPSNAVSTSDVNRSDFERCRACLTKRIPSEPSFEFDLQRRIRIVQMGPNWEGKVNCGIQFHWLIGYQFIIDEEQPT